MGRDKDVKIKAAGKETALWEHIERTTFPGVQGTPYLNNIAAKAVFFRETLCDEYRARQFRIVENARRLADALLALGHNVLTGGTDNHMVLVNAGELREGLTGFTAQKCLEDCGIIVNMNKLPYDKKGVCVTSGLRLGTPIVTKNGMGKKEMDSIAEMIALVLRRIEIISDTEYRLEESVKEQTKNQVKNLCSGFPMF